jgi:hypothetical protein
VRIPLPSWAANGVAHHGQPSLVDPLRDLLVELNKALGGSFVWHSTVPRTSC